MTPTQNPATQTTATRSLNCTVSEQSEKLKAAWTLLAPETLFSDLTCAEFGAAIAPSRQVRESLANIKLAKRAAVSARNHADAATRPVVKRVIAAVQADPNLGPDSSLYRAMGFTPDSERKSPSKAEPGVPAGRRPRVLLMERLEIIIAAWIDVNPEMKLGGMSRADFTAATAPSVTTRAALVSVNTTRKRTIGDRNASDTACNRLNKRVIAGIKADPAFGPDSALYRALGYIPESERKTAKRTAPVESAPGTNLV